VPTSCSSKPGTSRPAPRGERLAHALELGVDRLGLDDDLGPRHLEPLVKAELGGRDDPDLEREGERRPLVGQSAEVDLGLTDGREASFAHRFLVPVGQRLAHGLLDDGGPPEALQDDCRWGLALAEPRDLQVAGECAGGLVDLAGHRLRLDLDLDAYPRGLELGEPGRELGGHRRGHDSVGSCPAPA
jgi:hypothetical protein